MFIVRSELLRQLTFFLRNFLFRTNLISKIILYLSSNKRPIYLFLIHIYKKLFLRDLTRLKKGEQSRVIGFSDTTYATKMISMGIRIGASIIMIQKSPLGHTFYVSIDELHLGLIRKEAESITIY